MYICKHVLCFACSCVHKKFTKNTKPLSMAASPDTAEGISFHRLLYFSPCTWMPCATKHVLLPLKQTKKSYLAYLLAHVHVNFYSTDLNLAALSSRDSTLKPKSFSAHELEGYCWALALLADPHWKQTPCQKHHLQAPKKEAYHMIKMSSTELCNYIN